MQSNSPVTHTQHSLTGIFNMPVKLCVMNTADRPERLPKAIRVQNTLFNQYNLLNRKKWQKRIIARDLSVVYKPRLSGP